MQSIHKEEHRAAEAHGLREVGGFLIHRWQGRGAG